VLNQLGSRAEIGTGLRIPPSKFYNLGRLSTIA